MGFFAARFFAYVQGAAFYQQIHREAVALLPPGAGKTWFDIGCGPGLVARLAAERGYRVMGFDSNADAVEIATRHSGTVDSPRFACVALESIAEDDGTADVVSAASLLRVVKDRPLALRQLLKTLAPKGVLLVVETGHALAWRKLTINHLTAARGRRSWILGLLVLSRMGAPPLDVKALCPEGYTVACHALGGGLVNAWILRRDTDDSMKNPFVNA